ncbi:MAG: beta-galactosidase trimerization domain-containing protein [Verrucomicrobiota bacterium]
MKTLALILSLFVTAASAQTHFIEAETFTPSGDGWKISNNSQARRASLATTLHGATGAKNSTAHKILNIKQAGAYRIWLRHNYHARWRGNFNLSVSQNDKTLGSKTFDNKIKKDIQDWDYAWDHFDLDLPAGEITLTLSKDQNKNSTGYVRHVDCLLLTSDKNLIPDHLAYGPQTWLRITLGDIYEKLLQIHVFADHHRSPWYQHFSLSKAGAQPGLRPKKEELLKSGEQTPWCNITPMLYQDNGAILNFSARYSYANRAERLLAKFEFASAPDQKSIVRTMDADSTPGGLVVVVPPNLSTPLNRSRLKRDAEFAQETGKRADQFPWPTMGKKPQRFPFFVSVQIGGYGTLPDQSVIDREWKTLDYFGFSNREKSYLGGGIWLMKDGSFCNPDTEKMKKNIAARVKIFKKEEKKLDDVVYCFLTDEPTGQPSAFIAKDPSYLRAFQAWLKKLGNTPADLLVNNWNEVKPVAENERDQFPALHYFTQRFRTRALGDFMATQRDIIKEAYGRSFPTLVNFSDGATYTANFYGQGVDYFELLNDDGQNAIWGEDWANGSSSYQCGAFNVDLMRAAARQRGQTIGHYLIAHAGRKPWDIKTKAASEVARGVKILKNFSYGVSWGSHEGGPFWKSHTWYAHPHTWRANAEVVREIGGAEDLLLPAMPKPAEVAILYSSSTDAWMLKRNSAYGFNRMHTWMALAHAQIPVDFISEQQVDDNLLKDYKVCYLSGPNLTRTTAAQLKNWVEQGGTLFLTAAAASRDEYNRPLHTLDALLPAKRASVETLQAYLSSGSGLYTLKSQDSVKADGLSMDTLSLRQALTAKDGSNILATFQDGTPAAVSAATGKGKVFCLGFLPALDYIKKAEAARIKLQGPKVKQSPASAHPAPPVIISAEDLVAIEPKTRLERSRNPWDYPADVRDFILTPVRSAKVTPPLTCSVPLVDAVVMHAPQGIIIPLSNYTLEEINQADFTLKVDRPIKSVESIYHGQINFQQNENQIAFSLPLNASDYVKIYYQD